jgi:hypothetical protein
MTARDSASGVVAATPTFNLPASIEQVRGVARV